MDGLTGRTARARKRERKCAPSGRADRQPVPGAEPSDFP